MAFVSIASVSEIHEDYTLYRLCTDTPQAEEILEMYSGRRHSQSQYAQRQRPILLRSSATQPSVTASDEIQASLVSPRTARRAADLLSKVADYSGPYETADVGSPSHSHQASEAIMIQSNRVPSSTTTTLSTPTSSLNGRKDSSTRPLAWC